MRRLPLYILVAVFALPLLLSATASQASASNWETPENATASSGASTVTDSFETDHTVDMNGWTYSENDNSGTLSLHSQYSGWKKDGSYSWYLQNDGAADAGDNCQVAKTFEFGGWHTLNLTTYTKTTGDNTEVEILIDGVQKWFMEVSWGSGQENTAEIDVSDLSGDKEVVIKLSYPNANTPSGSYFMFDKLEIIGEGGPLNTIDESTSTKWRPLPENENGAWANWDLGSLKRISGCRIYWGANENYRSTAYRIRTSTDNSSWTTVVTETSAAPASAWKEYSWSENLAHYIELVVDNHGDNGTDIYEMDADVKYVTIENITVDNSLVDRDLDYSGSGAELDTTITIRLQDNDGREGISAVYISIRDNDDSVVVDNVRVTDNTVINENELDFTYDYNPLDNLSDSALGGFDVLVVVVDNWGVDENNDWGGDGASLFTVDDLGMTVNISPDNAYLGYAWGYNLTASGDISRVSGSVSVDNSWLRDENAGQIILGASSSYSESYTITAPSGTENVYVRVRALDSPLDGENYNYYDVNENRLYEIRVRWESTYGLVPDGSGENAIENRNYHLTFYYPTATQEFDMTTNPENFVAYATVRKIRLDVTDDNYWRTRIPPTPGIVDMILVDNVGDLDQYEFTLKDLTGQFGIDDNGQLWFSRYIGDDFLHVHEDFWDAEDSVTAFLTYGKEYSLKIVTATQERSYTTLTADGILTKEISVSTFTMPDSRMIWDDVGWSTWWSDNDLKVSYQDNESETDNTTVNIYDENDSLVYTENFITNQWTLTWTGANENLDYVVELDIAHQTFGASTVSTDILMPSWTPPIEEEGGIPGIGQLGTLPFTWGAGIGIILVITIAYTFGARHAGFCVLTIGMFLVMLGPVMGLFRLNPDPLVEWGFASFIIVMGVLIMLTKRGG